MRDRNGSVGGPVSRRSALAAGLAGSLAGAHGAVAAEPVTALVRRAAEANDAFIRGDMQTWLSVAGPIAPDFTLMQPFGGPASRGFDASPARLTAMSHYFTGGEASLEVAATYASDELAVLVMVERQAGEVGGLPRQDWSLRVTQVYRRSGDAWQLVHRHADPLARRFGLERTAALARGEGAS